MKVLAPVLVFSLLVTPLAQAQTVSKTPITDAVSKNAVLLAQGQGTKSNSTMDPMYKWTGIGLIGGGVLLGLGEMACTGGSGCTTFAKTAVISGVIIGAGVGVLIYGRNHATPSLMPGVAITKGGVALQSRYSFGARSTK